MLFKPANSTRDPLVAPAIADLQEDKADKTQVLTDVPLGSVFTDTVYDDTPIRAAVALNTDKVSDVDHPLVETSVPTGAVFTDTVYDDTAVTLNITGIQDKLSAKGAAVLDFGTGSKTAETVVTGVTGVEASSVILADMRLEATAEHPIDDLLIDPIQVSAHSIVAGVGFTLHGEMLNASTSGNYKAQWALR